uniref:Uncharacterized protein LOC104239151 n=1 Tax=Nicotiana sylvestris TaxID=4096 RepID=A0A1U7XQV2_NICSY|nr:PREDICTED: uncharacterized protein LOC104239151 [Nicotiana sylvestris]
MQKGKEVNDKLSHYKELDKSMTFKDLEEAKKNKKGPGFKIKTLKTEHNCEDVFENPRAKTKTLAEYFRSKVQNNPKLEAYANEIRESNPDSDVVINLSKDAMAEGKRRFLRMYICFNAMKLGFKQGLRPFIGLDGTFLKGHCKGQLLVDVAQDCQNHFYPLAWVVVDKENTLTWTWFLELLKHSLNLKDGTSITFMSDMQNGLLEAVRIVLPLSNHRFCVRHIDANWSKRIRISGEMKKYLWWSAWSTYEEDFKDQLKNLGELSVDIVKELLRYPPQNWCRSYFDTLCIKLDGGQQFYRVLQLLDLRSKRQAYPEDA